MKIMSVPRIKLAPSTPIDLLEEEHKHLSQSGGYCEYMTIDGKKLMLFHGSNYGTIAIPLEVAITADIIVCCYPRRVGLMYPELLNKIYRPIRNISAIIGTWISWQGEDRFAEFDVQFK